MSNALDLSRRQYLSGRVDLAEATLQAALAAKPTFVEALFALGMIAAETGRPEVATRHMEAALKVNPDYAPALCWMSFLQLQANRFQVARGYAERAVVADPQRPASEIALGRSLVGLGSIREALPHFQRAVEIAPQDPGSLYEFADVLIQAGLWYQASDALKKGLQLAPMPIGFLKRAFCEHRLGRIESAEKICRKALQADPNLADAHLEMARILTGLRKFDEADKHWSRADGLAPAPGRIAYEKALSLSSAGLMDDAATELNRSIEQRPSQGDAYQSWAYSRRVDTEDIPRLRQMENLLDKRMVPELDRMNLLYALGKSYGDLGDFEKSMQLFDRANALRVKLSGSRPLDREAFSAMIDAQISRYSPSALVEGASRSESALPLLVAGMMRSGTTLVEQILTCHPKIGGAGEQQFLAENESVPPAAIPVFADEYIKLLSSIAPGFPTVIDKNPANLQAFGFFHLAFPNGRMIHVRRRAVDTALSIWMTPIRTTAEFLHDRESLVFAYKELMRLADHWRRLIPSDRLLEVRYEELVEQPEPQIRRMLEFCGVEWDEACLHPERNNRRVVTPSLWQVRQPLYRSSFDRWKRYAPWLGAFEALKGLA